MDMDAYAQRSELAQQSAQSEALVKVAKQLLPFVNQLRQMVISTPGDLEGNKRVDGVHLVYTKAIKDLEQLGITPISAEQGDQIDLNLHLPVSTTPVEDTKLQGKIVELVEQGYQLARDDEQRVILPCKVVVGQ
jgi:molecular chaperone GrpE (heat shock protein)